MSLHSIMAEERRLAILQALKEDSDRTVNELILRRWVASRVDAVDREQIRADLGWLEEHGLIRVEKLPAQPSGELWRATLRDAGLAVAQGKAFPGVAQPELG